MIIIKLQGGLGNQMFQYAFGRALSLKHKQRLFFDNTLLLNSAKAVNRTHREYELSLFPGLHVKMLPGAYKKIIRSESVLFSKINRRFPLISNVLQLENEFVRVDFNELKAINVFEGYFQGEKYFHEFTDQIRAGFRFPDLDKRNQEIKKKLDNSNSLAIHVRRGDYFTNEAAYQYHGVLQVEYYTKAIEIIRNAQPDLQYFIFTDDASWAKQNLLSANPDSIIVDGNTGAESWKDMALMTFAKHHIISNSSFSWWGAWLSAGNGMKIAPVKWFNPAKAQFDINVIIPEGWTLIDC